MKKWLFGIISLPVLVLLVTNVIFAGLLAMTYSALTREEPIALVSFEVVAGEQDAHRATLYDADGAKLGEYVIYGDQWRLDAAFAKIHYWANILLRVDSMYALDRIEGRYKHIEQQNAKRPMSYQIQDTGLIEALDFVVDTTYGSSVYKDIYPDRMYRIYKTPTGLLVRVSP